ncbi:unnamed protein product [Schistosoma turkestanicum]|nr:unnamed protein product [Schistosoma turkestanicum]
MFSQPTPTTLSSPVAFSEGNNILDSLALTNITKVSVSPQSLQLNNEHSLDCQLDKNTPLCNLKSDQKNSELTVLSNKRENHVTFLSPEYNTTYDLPNQLQGVTCEKSIHEVGLHENTNETEFSNHHQHEKGSSVSHFNFSSDIKSNPDQINNKDNISVNYLVKNNLYNQNGLHVELSDRYDTPNFCQNNDQHSTYNENKAKLRVQLERIFNKVTEKRSETTLMREAIVTTTANCKNSQDNKQKRYFGNYPVSNASSHEKPIMKNLNVTQDKSNYNKSEKLRILPMHITKVVNELRELLCGTWPLKSSRMLDVQKFACQKGLQYRQEHNQLTVQESQSSQVSFSSKENSEFKKKKTSSVSFENLIQNLSSPLSTELGNSKFSSTIGINSEDDLCFENIKRSVEKQLNNILRKQRDIYGTRSLSASSSPVKFLDRNLYFNKIDFSECHPTNKFVSNYESGSFFGKADKKHSDKSKPKNNVVINSSHTLKNKSNKYACQVNNYSPDRTSCLGLLGLCSQLNNISNHFTSHSPRIQSISRKKLLENVSISPTNAAENMNYSTPEIHSPLPSQNFLRLTNSQWDCSKRLLDFSFDKDVKGCTDRHSNPLNHNIKCIANNPERYFYSDCSSSCFDYIYVPGNNSRLKFREKRRRGAVIKLRRSKKVLSDTYSNNSSSLKEKYVQINPNECNQISNFILPRFSRESDLKNNSLIPANLRNVYDERLFHPSEGNPISSRLDSEFINNKI